MPRKPRIDAPGLLYHVIARGIERREIFSDEKDKKFFIEELGELLVGTNTQIYAFTLMPNHFHLLLRRIDTPISTLMRRLLTKYAIYYNKKHKRSGHLFQNRYKSIICQEELYLLELIRYINLNPIRAKIYQTPNELIKDRFTSHGYITGAHKRDWFDPEIVLSHFGKTKRKASSAYIKFINDGLSKAHKSDLSGGGLKRSLGTIEFNQKTKMAYDDRILGDGNFVNELIYKEEKPLSDRDEAIDKIISTACDRFEVSKQELFGSTKRRQVAVARAMLACRLTKELGLTNSEIVKKLATAPSAVFKMIKKGQEIPGEWVATNQ